MQPSPSQILLHPRPLQTSPRVPNPLPALLQTPSGLALLELQGTINLPPFPPDTSPTAAPPLIPIGRLHFPDYDPAAKDKSDAAWMKRAWLYVGEHQRLQGEVKRLPRAVAVVRKRGARGGGIGVEERKEEEWDGDGDGDGEGELEVVEVVKYKVVFSSRPEPVGSRGGAT
ncbi:hypothetical protein VTI74DRAFT_2676 [Chaetomium olivicolor]